MAIKSKTKIITDHGEFNVVYHEFENGYCISLHRGDLKAKPIVRIHSSCLFSEALHAIDCDCKLQLSGAIEMIATSGNGVIVYLYQEGRGHGLEKKIRAMDIMESLSCDTVDAFNKLGYELDVRDYKIAIGALKDLGVAKEVRLVSNNPKKKLALEGAGFVVDPICLKYKVNNMTKKYLRSKKDKLGHTIDWVD